MVRSMEYLSQTTEESKIRRWVRVIAVVELLSSMIGICVYLLIQSGIIQENLNWVDFFGFYFNTPAGLIIFAGLWRFKPWGWKAAVLLIPISCVFTSYQIITDYVQGVGLFVAPCILLGALIFRYLFKPEVMTLCKVSSTLFTHAKWFVHVLMCLAGSFFVSETGMVGLGVVLAISLGLRGM